jgi:hypothetical protein
MVVQTNLHALFRRQTTEGVIAFRHPLPLFFAKARFRILQDGLFQPWMLPLCSEQPITFAPIACRKFMWLTNSSMVFSRWPLAKKVLNQALQI